MDIFKNGEDLKIGAFVVDGNGEPGTVIRIFQRKNEVKVMLATGLVVTDPISSWRPA